MNYHMGDFGQVEVPKVVLEKPTEKFAVSPLLKLVGYGILGAVGLAGISLFVDYLQRRKYYYPDDLDAIENFKVRIKYLSEKLDDGTISNKEADELYQIVYNDYGSYAGYTSTPMQSPLKIKQKLEKFFKSQGT